MEQQTPFPPKSWMKPSEGQNVPFSHPWFWGPGRGSRFPIYFVQDCRLVTLSKVYTGMKCNLITRVPPHTQPYTVNCVLSLSTSMGYSSSPCLVIPSNSCKDHCTWTNSGEEKPDLVVDQDQQYKITLKIEGKADRKAKVYKFICPIFRPDKTCLHQGLEKLSRVS